MDPFGRTRENGTIDPTQDASTYPTNEKEVQACKKRTNREDGVTDDERSNTGLFIGSENGKSTGVGRDQDSNASLESDTDDETSGADEEIRRLEAHTRRQRK